MLLGNQWKDCIPLITIFSISSVFESTSRLRSSVLISLKLSKIIIRLQIYRGIFELVAIIIGLNWGIMGITVCYSFVILSYSIISLLYAISKTPLSFSDYYVPLFKPLMIMIFITSGFYIFKLNEINMNNVFFNFMGKASLIFLLFLTISILNRKLRNKLIKLYKQFRIQ